MMVLVLQETLHTALKLSGPVQTALALREMVQMMSELVQIAWD